MIGTYPVTFSVDYPDRYPNRLTSALRIFTVILRWGGPACGSCRRC